MQDTRCHKTPLRPSQKRRTRPAKTKTSSTPWNPLLQGELVSDILRPRLGEMPRALCNRDGVLYVCACVGLSGGGATVHFLFCCGKYCWS